MIQLLLFLAMSIQASPIPFKTVATGATSQIETSRTAVVRTSADWAALWKEHGGAGTPQTIDFNQMMIVAVFAGTRPTAGESVEITRIQERDGEIVVTYLARGPRPDEMVAQMLTQPFHIVSTAARGGKVSFVPATAGR